MPVENRQQAIQHDLVDLSDRLNRIKQLLQSQTSQNDLSDYELYRKIQEICSSLTAENEFRKCLHDMSNVLTVIVGRAELLSKTNTLEPREKRDLEEIVSQGNVCCSLLEKARNIIRNAVKER